MKITKPSKILQRFIADKGLFQYGDGKLKLIGVYGRITTVITSILLERLMEENFGKKKADDLLYLLAEHQSYTATKWAVEKIGLPRKGNELRILNEVGSHSQLTGHGKLRIIKIDAAKKELILAAENNMFCHQYKQIFGTQKCPVDHYTRGLIGGMGKYIFDENVVTICTHCPSMGKQSATYHILPVREALRKYGRTAEKFIPDPDLVTSTTKVVSIKNLTV